MLGLYIHIPFCNSLCKFCDFPKRINQNDKIKNNYVKKIIDDLNNLDSSLVFDTVYIGGGTPNSLPNDLLENLFKTIGKLKLKENVEFTIEANFELITSEQVQLFSKYHINRISIGIQTFNKRIGRYINRESDYEICKEKLQMLKDAGINNLNGDFIFGLPFQTLDDVKADLAFINSLPFTHVSYYSLILEDKTVLNYELDHKIIALPEDDLNADMYEFIINELKQLGFKQYEISNFAKDNYFSRHNMLYWQVEEYIGIGMSAASFYQNKRYTNSKFINEYLENVNITYDDVDMGEYFWLGLRMTDGVSLSKFEEKYHINPRDKYPINDLIKRGLIEIIDDNIRLTTLGLDHGNYVFECFI